MLKRQGDETKYGPGRVNLCWPKRPHSHVFVHNLVFRTAAQICLSLYTHVARLHVFGQVAQLHVFGQIAQIAFVVWILSWEKSILVHPNISHVCF
jgi:hypothetical protein